ncbi:hypothetical protein OAH18_01545 [bacterium]|nr:hypothetical protein [bacterium]
MFDWFTNLNKIFPARKRLRSRRTAFHAQLLEDRALLATIAVTTFDDVVANDGEVSLREAITQANGSTAADEIVLEQGTYTLSLTGDEDQNASGDLNLLTDIIIRGAGSDLTVIDAGGDNGISERVMDVRGTTVRLEGITLTGGRSEDSGGGLLVSNGVDSSLVLSDVHVTDNSADKQGGGVYLSHSNVTISDSRISSNSAEFGGGINNSGANSSLAISTSTISENSIDKVGGGVHSSWGATTTIDSSTISNNTSGWAGGVGNLNARTTILNSTISSNTATTHQPAILTYSSGAENSAEMVILQTTIANNQGAGLKSQIGVGTYADAAAAVLRIGNTLVAGNSGTEDTFNIDGLGTVTSLGHNLFDNDTNGLIAANGDQTSVATPTIDLALRDNGGPTLTHALLPDSTAIDMGDNALAVNPGADHIPGQGNDDTPIEFSQRRSLYDRINNDTVDIGAFERHTPIAFLSTQSQTLDEGDGVTSFEFWFTTDVPVEGSHSIESGYSVPDISPGDFELTPSPVLQITDGQQKTNVVTLTVIDDDLVEDLETSIVSFSPFGGLRLAPDTTMTVVIRDNDQAGFELNETQLEVSELGGTVEFTIVLTGRPADDVVIGYSTDNPTAATVSSGPLTFTTENWNTPQTVTVTGVDDFIAGGARMTNIEVSVNQPVSDSQFKNLARQSVTVTTTDSPEFSFDVDDNSGQSALTDGILLVRYLAGFGGNGLTANAVDETQGQRLTATEIIDWLDPHRTNAMDVDGDGQTAALSDGIMMLRYLAGFTGDTLIAGAVGANAQRTTAGEIEFWLDQFANNGAASGPVAGTAFGPVSREVGSTGNTDKRLVIQTTGPAAIEITTALNQPTQWRSLFENDSKLDVETDDFSAVDRVFGESLIPSLDSLTTFLNFGESPKNGI